MEFMPETERLIIRQFTPQDLEKLIESRPDDEVIKYLGKTEMHYGMECFFYRIDKEFLIRRDIK